VKAQLIGFIWQLGQGIAIDDFFAHLAVLKDRRERFGDYDRLLYVGQLEDYHVGLFLKLKDQRRFTEITDSGGQFKITVRSLDQGNNLCDFNFFMINKKTCRGLYQYYHQSCSFNQFSIFCAQQYEGLKQSRIEADLGHVGGDGASPRDKRRVNKTYKGSLTWENIVKQESLKQLLEELEQIKFFDFNIATIDESDPWMTPLKRFVKKNRRIVRFKAAQVGLVNAIIETIQNRQITTGRVGGTDAEKRERVYRLIENPDKFAEFEYEDIADETTLNVAEVERSPFFEEMLRVVNSDPGVKAIFESPVNP
jgi:hypothetical protein